MVKPWDGKQDTFKGREYSNSFTEIFVTSTGQTKHWNWYHDGDTEGGSSILQRRRLMPGLSNPCW